ncbi:sarcosine oxidase subunit gamma [Frigidibacter sp.]|uniref:sarcosine oxidase subunit gamma n=1 Tax=Frigidibacter sp. TaxID=2586418 RepID=UPI002736C85A|nr:sarcosine oxidase subunit gamma family protein [Frigidibacter sp.]MDP3339759.1 sarcosine oxidase subunit gamma family protein [Frigidibacter sp.]
MSEQISALVGRSYSGFSTVAEAGLVGMVTLRGDLGSAELVAAVLAATGCAMPGQRRRVVAGDWSVCWMSPDELLLVGPYASAPGLVDQLTAALEGQHALAVDVSDARASFSVTGPKAAEVLMKLCPVDFAALAEDEVRRTRLGQIAAALWKSGRDSGREEYSLVCFRSVASYAFGVLENAARPGSELFAG